MKSDIIDAALRLAVNFTVTTFLILAWLHVLLLGFAFVQWRAPNLPLEWWDVRLVLAIAAAFTAIYAIRPSGLRKDLEEEQ